MRDKLKQPFDSLSIWNHPIGSDAQYVPANIDTAQGMTVEEDIIILTPNATVINVFRNNDEWTGRSRCEQQGDVLFRAPLPPDFIIPAAGPNNTPNNSAAILAANGRTLLQAQPFTHCSVDSPFTAWVTYPSEDIFGAGIEGAHGGSGLSSIGGTIRLGELVPGGTIPHALKINIDAGPNIWGTMGDQYNGDSFRWPAVKADACAPSCYGGNNPALAMGALLALHPDFPIEFGLETEPARMIAHALKYYGGYVVDSTAWDVYAIATEFSPDGHVIDEFYQAWGFAWRNLNDNPWTRDIRRIFDALHVIDNNGPDNIGGGGTPRVAFAKPLEDEAPVPEPPYIEPTPPAPEPPIDHDILITPEKKDEIIAMLATVVHDLAITDRFTIGITSGLERARDMYRRFFEVSE